MSAVAARISEVFDPILATEPGRVALVTDSGTLTYEQLDAQVNAAAALMSDLGVKAGDRVAAALPNDLDIVLSFHGAMRLGAIWLGINSNLAPPEKNLLLEASGTTFVFADPATAEQVASDRTSSDRHATVVAIDRAVQGGDWYEGLRAHAGASRPTEVDPGLPAAIAYTSGTTGLPKGIVHSQHNLLLPGAAVAFSRGWDETLRKGDCLPLTILNLQVLTTLLTASVGGCCLLTDQRHARGVADWIERDSVTVWNGVPALLYSMVHDETIKRSALSSLSEVWTGGADCPEGIFGAFEERFGVPVRATYGLTEAPTVVAIDPVDGPHTPGASGQVLPSLKVVVRGADNQPLPAGEQGEITVRAATVGPWAGAYTPMLGLWTGERLDPSTETELRTGDLGWLDPNGYVVIHDRLKLLIIRGGANVYPAEVERVMAALPGIQAAVALGLPDERLGQRVVAAVELAAGSGLTPEQIIAYCREQLARYKVPEQVVIVDAFPRNAMGKVPRGELADLFSTGPTS